MYIAATAGKTTGAQVEPRKLPLHSPHIGIPQYSYTVSYILKTPPPSNSGLLLVRRDEAALNPIATHVILQKRSASVNEPNTWSIPGGALDFGETPVQAAVREGVEETSLPADCLEGENPLLMIRETVALTRHPLGGADGREWVYSTVICDVRGEFEPRLSTGVHGGESTAVEWVPIDEVEDGKRVLHPGFRDGWRTLKEMVLRVDRPSVRIDVIDLTGDSEEED